jgi:hypothetical protein
MPVHSIFPDALNNGQPPNPEQARAWCAGLETGSFLYFPQTQVPVPDEDLRFLLGRLQTDSRFHKNIAYKPASDGLAGVS